MTAADGFIDGFLEYLHAVKLLIAQPQEFFKQSGILPEYRAKLLFALPPILIYGVAQAALHRNPFLIPLHVAASYVEILVWMAALRLVLLMFGERRSFDETLLIAATSAIVFLVAWIPVAGAPLAVIAAGALSVQGLTHSFKMNNGAALAAVALPVVVTGLVGAVLSWIFILLASFFQIFADSQ